MQTLCLRYETFCLNIPFSFLLTFGGFPAQVDLASGPNMEITFHVLTLNHLLPTMSPFSGSLVLHGSW